MAPLTESIGHGRIGQRVLKKLSREEGQSVEEGEAAAGEAGADKKKKERGKKRRRRKNVSAEPWQCHGSTLNP